jgi:hypothetical protein
MYILTHPSLSSSARLLAERLEELIEKNIEISYVPMRTAPSIRWGNSHGEYESDTEFNNRRGIRIAGNKLAFSNFLSNKNTPFVEINSGTPKKYPVIVRTILNGSEGDGIVICRNTDEFMPYVNYNWSYFYKFQYELGVHMLGGSVKKVFKKVWIGESSEPEIPIRNMHKGYHFKKVRPENFEKLHPFVRQFYSDFYLEFCRMDVGWDQENHCYRLIEVNTAPSLSNNEDTLDLYANFIAERAR